MDQRHSIKFNSYDRFFPNQDTMPKGGFGNLIALPLQRKARNYGNSVFVDEQYAPYVDQWAFLSSLRRINVDELERYTTLLGKGDELGILNDESDEKDDKPWQKNLPVELSSDDFPTETQIVEANMLYIEKSGFSARALNRLKRLAAFKNPEFYKAQAMRLSTWDKPRIISISEETEEYLCLPRGCKNAVHTLLESVKVNWQDKRNAGRDIDVEFNGVLRSEQEVALTAMIAYDNGILSATTAFGKTVLGAALIAERKVNTLVLVNRQPLLDQWKNRLYEFLSINEALPEEPVKRGRKKQLGIIGLLGGGKTSKESKLLLEQVASAPHEQRLVIVATGKYVGEGFDAPRLDALFLAYPFSWEGTLAQYAGRLHRLHDEKDEVQIYDYIDVHAAKLERMYSKRAKGYTANGYTAKCEGVIPAEGNIIFDSSSFLPVFTADLIAAKREIVIVSPFLTQNRITKMMDTIEMCILSGVCVTAVTRPAEDYTDKERGRISSCIELLRKKSVTVIEKTKIHQKFAIADERVVWYGSVNLLSFGSAEESIMRLDSAVIASELLSIMR